MASIASFSSRADVAIVGAGAAGLATAIFAREQHPAREVVLLDGAKRPGAKILVSGGGRCNVTNVAVSERDFWGGSRNTIRRVLKAFTAGDTVAFFSRLGVPLHEENDGKLFPDSNRARQVLDALLRESDRAGVRLYADHRVRDVTRDGEGFVVHSSQAAIAARRVVLATGGCSLPKSGSDGVGYQIAQRLGHTIVPQTPALAPLVLADGPDAFHKPLSGVAHDAELLVWIDGRASSRLSGALLWTHFGISGPVALDASRHWARAALEGRRVAVTVNFFPGTQFEAMDERLVTLAADHPRSTWPGLLSAWLPASVVNRLVESSGIDPRTACGQVSRDDRRRLAHALVELPLPVIDTRGYNYAEATAGGVSLREIDPSTMESRICPGLYLVGEMLDVDGRIGGFNFQWAWSSGHVAAAALAHEP